MVQLGLYLSLILIVIMVISDNIVQQENLW